MPPGEAAPRGGAGRGARFAEAARAAGLNAAGVDAASALLADVTPCLGDFSAAEEPSALEARARATPPSGAPVALVQRAREAEERIVFALVLFVAAASSECGQSTLLTAILRATGVTLVDFFREVSPFLKSAEAPLRARFAVDAEEALQVFPLKRALAFSLVLAEKYRRLFHAVLGEAASAAARTPVRSGSCGGGGAGDDASADDPLLRFGWCLFCLAKQRLLGSFADLAASVHLLVAVIAFLVAHAAAERRCVPLSDGGAYPVRRAGGTSADVVASLAATSKTSAALTAAFLEQLAASVVPLLGAAAPACVSWDDAAAAPHAEARAGPHCFPGLLAPAALPAAAEAASAAYAAAMREGGVHVDERDFLRGSGGLASAAAAAAAPDAVGHPSRLTPRRGCATPAPLRGMGACLPSPFRQAPPSGGGVLMTPGAAAAAQQSPISRALAAAAWLRTAAASPAGIASPTLQRFLAATPEPAALEAAIAARVDRMAWAIFPTPPAADAAAGGSAAAAAAAAVAPAAVAAPAGHVGGAASSAAAAAEADLFRGMAASAELLAANAAAAAEERRRETSALYYRQLELLLMREEARTAAATAASPASTPTSSSPPSFAPLLCCDAFHRGVFAICAELVCEAHKAGGRGFPRPALALHLHPFDCAHLVPLIVAAESGLPRDLKRHLNGVMERILEGLAWESGSTLYDLLMAACGGGGSVSAGNAAAAAAGASGGGNAAAAATLLSGTTSDAGLAAAAAAAGANVPIEAAGAASQPPLPGLLPLAFGPRSAPPPGPAAAKVGSFLAQVSQLLGIRLGRVADRLLLPAPLRAAAAAVLDAALFEATSLFYGRHADTLLLCALYGVAKAAAWPRREAPLMFRDIIRAYSAAALRDRGTAPDEALFRAVPMEFVTPLTAALEALRRDDIIKFYNEAFVPTVKPHLLKAVQAAGLAGGGGAGAGGGAASGSGVSGGGAQGVPAPSESPARGGSGATAAAAAAAAAGLLASPRRVSGAHNVVVSPLRPEREASLFSASPRRGALFAFVGESAQAYQTPSRDLAHINARVAASAGASADAALLSAGGAGLAAVAAAAAAAASSEGRPRPQLSHEDVPPPQRRRMATDAA